ncbi:MAG: hypothetical protein IJ865_05905 [Clostridia bacterium]|nr:hypothetical protein [Clostridia bacterium]
MNSGKSRATLLGIVGVYVIYLAYQLSEGRAETDTTMSPGARYAFIALFVLCGIAVLVYALRVWKRSGEEEQQQDDGERLK